MVVIVLLLASPAMAQQVDHAAWDSLVRRHVTHGLVDYQAIQKERALFDRYVERLASVDPAQLDSTEERLAFWINAYNALVVHAVLERYPLASVKRIRGFFDGLRYEVGGRTLTLNDVEAQGRALGDWRIHMALVCASSSCPPLRSEAYVASRLNLQLTEQAMQFLSDTQRGLRVDGNTLWLSKIYDWYAADFAPAAAPAALHRLTPSTLLSAIRPYLKAELARVIGESRLGLKFLDYNWSLNQQVAQP